MKPSTTITVVLIMAVVSVTLTDARPQEDPAPVNGTCNGPHEQQMTSCGPPIQCIPTCTYDGISECGGNCVLNPCICDDGYIRESTGGPCILPCKCPDQIII